MTAFALDLHNVGATEEEHGFSLALPRSECDLIPRRERVAELHAVALCMSGAELVVVVNEVGVRFRSNEDAVQQIKTQSAADVRKDVVITHEVAT